MREDGAETKIHPAQPFREMVERIERNLESEFQGAFVILTPDGVILSSAVFDRVGDPQGFWALLEVAISKHKETYRG